MRSEIIIISVDFWDKITDNLDIENHRIVLWLAREGESDQIQKVNSEVSVHSGPVGLISDRDKGCFQTKFLKKNQRFLGYV